MSRTGESIDSNFDKVSKTTVDSEMQHAVNEPDSVIHISQERAAYQYLVAAGLKHVKPPGLYRDGGDRDMYRLPELPSSKLPQSDK